MAFGGISRLCGIAGPDRTAALAAHLNERADRARDAGQCAQAAILYEEALQLQPDQAALHIQCGHMFKDSGNLGAAERHYLAANRLTPDDPDLALQLGHFYKVAGRLGLAAASYRRALELKPDWPVARAELAALQQSDLLLDAPADDDGDVAQRISQSGLFDPADYLARYPEVRRAGLDPLTHYMEHGATQGFRPHVLFDSAFYLERYPDIAERHTNPLEHYVRYGGWEGRFPNPFFDSKYYVTHNPDAARSGLNPLAHYIQVGAARRAKPSARFDVDYYLSNNPGLEDSGKDPLEHFILTGQAQRQKLNPRELRAGSAFALEHATVLCLKTPIFGPEMALFVAHSPDGSLKPHVRFYLEALRRDGVGVILIVASDTVPLRFEDDVADAVDGIFLRTNEGFDFAAWAHVIQLAPEVLDCDRLFLLNDSLFGPLSDAGFTRLLTRIRKSDAGLVGLTQNQERGWHIQSYFLALRASALRTLAVQRFLRGIVSFKDKDDVIDEYECGMAPTFEKAGVQWDVMFPTTGATNPTIFQWKELLAADFPFVKVMTLRDEIAGADRSGWRELLAGTEYDLRLIDRTLNRARAAAPATSHAADEPRTIAVPSDPKVTFIGPWNYDNGLAGASRGYVAALRRSGLAVNYSPIKRPFHVHRQIAPPVDVEEFTGKPDAVVVHLNPDAWSLLTDEQREVIEEARFRIGLWVWESRDIPDNWYPVFDRVDVIWTPSQYCAETFRAKAKCPVEVVPHVIVAESEDPHDADETAEVRNLLNVSAEHRIILYVFDGASYLVRKNPFALVRAFRKSGLERSGWRLVLKTKHLNDRPRQGRELEALARAAPGVILIDRPMSPGAMATLMRMAAVYASPHCSEGFGLTIAEAMAAGKIVVATDFGGSRDFLDPSCGIPVDYTLAPLDGDHGHYRQGSLWAFVDEVTLAKALQEAADAVESGDTRLGEAARARIQRDLSPDAIAGRMVESIGRTLQGADAPDLADWPVVRDSDRLIALPLARSGACQPGRRVFDASDRDHWVVIAPMQTALNPALHGLVVNHAENRPDLDILYGDEVVLGEERRPELLLKPDFDAALLQSGDYMGYPLLVRASAMARLGGLRSGAGTACAYDLVLRAAAMGLGIGRMAEVLASVDHSAPRATLEDRRAALQAWHDDNGGRYDVAPGLTDNSLQLKRRFSTFPSVTLVIPTRQSVLPDQSGGTPCVVALMDSIARTDWPMDNLQVLVGDDVADEAAYAGREWPFRFTRLVTARSPGEPFNYSAKMNRLWRAAETDFVVLMNDDLLVRGSGWLRALMTFAMQDDVGAVGARLLFADDTIQHAGMAGGLFDLCAHPWLYEPADAPTYQDWALVHRQWSMVTGAVCATRRSVLETVGGFDERFALEFNDTDLCLRIRMQGLRVVYTPFAELTHFEKASRGDAQPPGSQLAMFLKRWSAYLDDDPAFHPGLERTSFKIAPRRTSGGWWTGPAGRSAAPVRSQPLESSRP